MTSTAVRRCSVGCASLAAVTLLVGCGTSGVPGAGGTSQPSPVSSTSSPQPSPHTASVGTVSGQVLLPDGTPAQGCTIDKGGGTEEAVVVDASGRFTFTQQPGEWTVRFNCSTADDKDATPVTVKPGEVTTITVRLTKA